MCVGDPCVELIPSPKSHKYETALVELFVKLISVLINGLSLLIENAAVRVGAGVGVTTVGVVSTFLQLLLYNSNDKSSK